MDLKIVEQYKTSSNFNNSGSATPPIDFKAQDIEIKRASQQSNDIYVLQLQAKHGSCNAIKKLINYNLINFSPDSDFAKKLISEATQMLKEQIEIYTTSCGELSDVSINSAKAQVANNNNGKKSDMEMAQEYNDLINDMQLGCY